MSARPRFFSTAQMMRTAAVLRRAIITAGGAARLAQQLGLQAVSVSAWTFCPAGYVDAVSVITGVSRSDLRPDLPPRADTTSPLTAEQATAAHLAAGAHFARTGRCLSAEAA